MVERFREGVKEHGGLVATAILVLFNGVCGLVVYLYTHELDDLKDDIKTIDTRVARAEQTIAERGERIRAIEDSNTHLNSDMSRIGHQLETLDSKIDRLIEQTMRQQPMPRAN